MGFVFFPCTTCVRILLSPSIWMSINLACAAALIPLRVAVASATNADAAPRLNAAAYRKHPFQSQMINPPSTAPCELLDPSQLILTNLPCDFCQDIHCVFL